MLTPSEVFQTGREGSQEANEPGNTGIPCTGIPVADFAMTVRFIETKGG